MVKILKVDPGGYSPWVARLTSTELSLSVFEIMLSHSARMVFGSKSGLETMARIFPVDGSMAMTAPRFPPKA